MLISQHAVQTLLFQITAIMYSLFYSIIKKNVEGMIMKTKPTDISAIYYGDAYL